MAVKVKIPTPLRSLTNNLDQVPAQGETLREVVLALDGSYPGMRERILDDGGEIRRFVNVYVNGEDVRFLKGLATVLGEGDEISIVPAVAGG
ncbi:MAG: MoaD/ThiS family protein [Chloroflexi bacterium]|nr:MoaD/ThiS family protein [Chloroflexota bacterium]